MRLCGLRFKKHIIFHILYIYCCSSMPRLSETCRFLQSSSFWEARRALIGQLSSALWLAKYLKRETEMLCSSPYCDAVSQRDDTKTIKPIISEAFVASSEDIITDYSDLYCLFTRHVASHRVNITMSAFVIRETTNNKCYSTLLKTHVWIISGKFFKYENILTGCESEAPDCPCKVGIAPLYRNSLWASQHCWLLSQVQEIVLRKMRCTHSNIWVELFWNSVVNTT